MWHLNAFLLWLLPATATLTSSPGRPLVEPRSTSPQCSPAVLQNLTLADAAISTITAAAVSNYTFINPFGTYGGNIGGNYTNLHFCNVTITYSHPPSNDSVTVNVWLPLDPSSPWNGRFQGTGGGGFATGSGPSYLAAGVAQGYAAADTDGGHSKDPVLSLPAEWALDADGAVDQQLLVNFAYLALYEMTVLGKAVTAAVYGAAPRYAYWHGCSQGGRQGLTMAQRYPDAYDGILALSPSINWHRAIVPMADPHVVANSLGYHPPRCELLAITAAAVAACDGQDGLEDGILSLPGLCDFDATTLVGSAFDCNGTELTVSREAAEIANAAWNGPRNSTTGELSWYGLTKDALLVTSDNGAPGLASTICGNESDASTCTPAYFEVARDWIKYFLLKDPEYDFSRLSLADEDRVQLQSIAEYEDTMGTANADLSAFRASGGKMITSHGLADSLVTPNNSLHYYDRVLQQDAAAQDYYRLYMLPGVHHCTAGGPGPYPTEQMEALTNWVERGEAPDTLTTSFDLVPGGKSGERLACLYPAEQVYVGGDPYLASSFSCQ